MAAPITVMDLRNRGGHQQRDERRRFLPPGETPHKTWFEYCRGYTIFFPYLWPSKSTRLQGVVLVCFIIVVCQRWVNIMVPFQIGVVTDSLEDDEGNGHMPWGQLLLLISFKLLQGSSGLLGSPRSILWIPVSQHTYRALTTAAFEHVHSLSRTFTLASGQERSSRLSTKVPRSTSSSSR